MIPESLKRAMLAQIQEAKITPGQAVKIMRREVANREARLRARAQHIPHHSSGFHNETTGVSPSLARPYFG